MENQENENGLLAGNIPVMAETDCRVTEAPASAAIGPDGLSNVPTDRLAPPPVDPEADRKRAIDKCISRINGWLLEVGDGSAQSVDVMQRIINDATNSIEQGYLWPFDQDAYSVKRMYALRMDIATSPSPADPLQMQAECDIARILAVDATADATLNDVVAELKLISGLLSSSIFAFLNKEQP
jgi:hypothetical protein